LEAFNKALEKRVFCGAFFPQTLFPKGKRVLIQKPFFTLFYFLFLDSQSFAYC